MKVLHVVTVADSLIFLRGRSRWMDERGVTTEVACSPGRKLDEFGSTEGVTTHPVPMRRAISPAADVVALIRLVRVMRRQRPDVVHAHTPKGGLLGMVAAWLTRVPARIHHIHGLPFETATGWKRRVLTLSEWMSCRLATHVLAVSESILTVARDEGVCPPGRGQVLNSGSINGVDIEQFSPNRTAELADRLANKLGLPRPAPVIGFVGRLVVDKGIVTLTHAWRELRLARSDLVLLLVGSWEDRDAVPDTIKTLLLEDDRVYLAGFMDDPAPAFALMSILAFPSRREGFGLAAIEAGAMAIPVVASDIPGLCDAVQDGVTGTLVPADDHKALCAALDTYLESPSLREDHGAAGQARARADFRPERIWAETLTLYLRAVGGIRG